MRRMIMVTLILVWLVSLCPLPQAYEPPGSEGEWDFVMSPYLWLPARSDITSSRRGRTGLA